MKISGRAVAEEIRSELKTKILKLKEQGIVPKIAIITLGSESSWESYVRQKIKVAGLLGIKAVHINLSENEQDRLFKTIKEINQDPLYHGLIVQRPLSAGIDREKVVNSIDAEKDVDGFRPGSKFGVPVWLAVKDLIERSFNETGSNKHIDELSFAVLGKGETAGMPTINGLRKMGIEPQIIDTKTQNREEILKNANVVISCAGRKNALSAREIKPGAVVIGVGTHEENGKIRGDYNEEEIELVAGAYTPTPGGAGPVNLAYLFSNLIDAALNKTNHNPQV